MKSSSRTRNPYYNKIPPQQVIQGKSVEPEVDEWDDDLIDMFNNKRQKAERVVKSARARNKRKEARNAKESRLFGE